MADRVPPELRALASSGRVAKAIMGVAAATCLAVAIPLCLLAIGLPWLPSLARQVPSSQLDATRLLAGSVGVGLIPVAVSLVLVGRLISRLLRSQEREFLSVVSTVAPRRARIEVQYDDASETYCVRLFPPGRDECLREFSCSANWDPERVNGEEVEAYVSSDPDDVVAVETSRGWLWSSVALGRVWRARGPRAVRAAAPS